ncbi:MAG: hypothetical protein IKN24_09005 [Lachnospiraceae bacterium]|nr:hypothetical protein [Lachnospiraceae bacterium]
MYNDNNIKKTVNDAMETIKFDKSDEDRILDNIRNKAQMNDGTETVSSRTGRRRGFRWVAAAAVSVAVLAASIMILNKPADIVYAAQTDYQSLIKGEPKDKVEFASDFSAYAADDRLCVMIVIYDMREAYADIYGQLFDGKTVEKLTEEYLEVTEDISTAERARIWQDLLGKIRKVNDDMLREEMGWLRSIGAEDVTKQNDNVIRCVMKAGNLSSIGSGACRYRVILAQKNTDSMVSGNISDYFGTYTANELVHIPLQSSFLITDKDAAALTVTFSEDGFYFNVEGDDFVSFDVKEPVYAYADNYDIENYYGFEFVDFMFMEPELVNFLSGEHAVIEITGGTKLFIGSTEIYLDAGLRGVYRLGR